MSDLEIVKELEKEIGTRMSEDNSLTLDNGYSTDENSLVIAISLKYNNLERFPNALLKLRNLKKLNLCGNSFSDISSLAVFEKLISLDISYNFNKIKKENIIEIISKLKNLTYFNLSGSFDSVFFDKDLLNHNLTLIFNDFGSAKHGLIIDGSEFFPPKSMVELGYNKSRFYFDNYSERWEEIVSIHHALDKNSNSGEGIKHEIISELLNKYYRPFSKKEVLPYAIRKISISNYQEINKLVISNISTDEQSKEIKDANWIILTGENGYGKTSLLQSIVIGMCGNMDEKNILSKDATIFLEIKNGNYININSVENIKFSLFPFQNFAAYGPSRLNKTTRRNDFGKTYSLFNTNGELLDIEEQLAIWEKDPQQNKYFESAKAILMNLLHPQVRDLFVERKGTTSFVKYIEIGDKVGKEFSELASGYRSIIAMIGDIIIRLSENQPEINNFSELAGIVIIDEIDLHLHPKWQKALVEKLTETFPKIQFIASTHSPIPLLGAPENTIVINVQRSEEKGITAERLDIDFSTLTPNSILSSPIFGFEELVPVSKPDDKFVNTEKNYKKIKEKEETRKEIAKYLSSGKTDEFLNLLNDDGQ